MTIFFCAYAHPIVAKFGTGTSNERTRILKFMRLRPFCRPHPLIIDQLFEVKVVSGRGKNRVAAKNELQVVSWAQKSV